MQEAAWMSPADIWTVTERRELKLNVSGTEHLKPAILP